MPTVRSYSEQVRSPRLRPVADTSIPEKPSPDVYGAQVGEAMSGLGQTITQVGAHFGAQANQIHEQATLDADRAAVTEGDNQLFEATAQLRDQALQVKGKDALGLNDQLRPKFDEVAARIAGNMRGERQQRAFEERKIRHWQALSGELSTHGRNEYETWFKAETFKGLDNTVSEFIRADDPQRRAELMAEGRAKVANYANNRLGPEATQALLLDFTTGAHKGAIDQYLALGEDQQAQRYFDTVTGQTRAQGDTRADGTKKGDGFFGVLQRPDGRVSTELSIGVEIDGQEVEIPTLVPTLTKVEVQELLSLDDRDKIPDAIAEKAEAYARTRLKAGLSPFAGPGEQNTALYPELTRERPRPSQIRGDVQTDLAKTLKGASTQGDGFRASADIWTRLGPKGDEPVDLDKMASAARALFADNPKAYDFTVKYLTEKAALFEGARKDRNEAVTGGLWKMVAEGATLDQLRRTNTYQAAPGKVQSALADYILQRTEREANRGAAAESRAYTRESRARSRQQWAAEEKENAALFDYYKALDDVHKLSDDQIHAMLPKLGERNVARLLEARRKVVADPKVLDDYRSFNEVINGVLRSAGQDPTPKESDKAAVALIGWFSEQVAAEQTRVQDTTKKKVTNAELEKIAKQVLGQQVLASSFQWPWVSGQKGVLSATIADVSNADKAEIRKALAALGVPNPSDEQILVTWINGQVEKSKSMPDVRRQQQPAPVPPPPQAPQQAAPQRPPQAPSTSGVRFEFGNPFARARERAREVEDAVKAIGKGLSERK